MTEGLWRNTTKGPFNNCNWGTVTGELRLINYDRGNMTKKLCLRDYDWIAMTERPWLRDNDWRNMTKELWVRDDEEIWLRYHDWGNMTKGHDWRTSVQGFMTEGPWLMDYDWWSITERLRLRNKWLRACQDAIIICLWDTLDDPEKYGHVVPLRWIFLEVQSLDLFLKSLRKTM